MKLPKFFLGLAGLILLLILGMAAFVERIPPATIGVRQSLWGGGVEATDFGMGFHIGIVGVHKWHLLDRRTHFLTFSESGTRSSMGQFEPPLQVRTKDNNTAIFDLTLTYRIKEGQGHRMVSEGLKDVYRDQIPSTVMSVVREELAELSSEDIYSTAKRLEVAGRAMPRLVTVLGKFFVEPDQLLIRAVRFTEAYEQKLQEKQLTYQQRLLAQAQEKVENQRALTETKEAEIEAAEKEARGDWDKVLEQLRATNELAVAKVKAESRVYDKRVRAEADAEFETLFAEGNLAVAKAEAIRDGLRNQALDTVGGRIFLAQQAAQNLQIENVTLNSNDPGVPSIIDIDALVRLLVGESDK